MKLFNFDIIKALIVDELVFGYHAKADNLQLYHNNYGVSQYARNDLHKL